jgi:predicted GH43/DUF377 family glycosyl hydrolase
MIPQNCILFRIFEDDYTVKMYYGAADTCIALAEAKLQDIKQRCSKISNSKEIIP